MRAFVTGATGWIGSAVVDELISAGHQVIGLARSDVAEQSLAAKGIGVVRGDLDDLASLRRGADQADAVIHMANKHDWGNPAESDRSERAAIRTFGDVLAGTGRPFVVAAPLSGIVEGRLLPRRPMSLRLSARTPTGAAARTSPWTTWPRACGR